MFSPIIPEKTVPRPTSESLYKKSIVEVRDHEHWPLIQYCLQRLKSSVSAFYIIMVNKFPLVRSVIGAAIVAKLGTNLSYSS